LPGLLRARFDSLANEKLKLKTESGKEQVAKNLDKMMMQAPQIDYDVVRQDVKMKAGILLTYFAVIRAAPIVIDAIFGDRN